MKHLLTLSFCFFLFSLSGQTSVWSDIEESRILLPQDAEVAGPVSEYRTLSMDMDAMKSELLQAPMEFSEAARQSPARISLPMPDGQLLELEVVESPVMAPELAARYPELKAYAARAVGNPGITARLDISPYAFHALVNTPAGWVAIAPYASNQTRYYRSYYARNEMVDPADAPPLSCGVTAGHELELEEEDRELLEQRTALSFRSSQAVPLRTYKMALACTGEYAQQKGGTLESVLATFNTSMNLLNAIYLNEFAIRFELIPDNDNLIFLDPLTDPYDNVGSGSGLLSQNIFAINSNIDDFLSYDIGHVFNRSCDVGGVAILGSVCNTNRASGVTCHYAGLVFMVTQVMTHEVGHQFRSGHSWSNCPPSMGQLSSDNAFEPGSGSTIMSYQNLCGGQNNIPGPSESYFNIGSIEDVLFFARESAGSTCGEEVITENIEPELTLDYEDGFWIPTSTPFELDVQAEDANGDALTYCWEQYDLGPPATLGEPVLNSPLFRSFPPTDDSRRVFPAIGKIISGQNDVTEVLPDYTRDLTFRVTVRDNNPVAGGTVWEEVAFKSDAGSGPFRVLTPVAADTAIWEGGQYREVLWDVANTTNNRVNCQYVDIYLSTDGGFSYPITLLEGTPNDGSAFVNVPNISTSNARIKVKGADNVFFNISESNFSIQEATEPGYSVTVNPVSFPLVCLPGEAVEVSVSTAALLGFDSMLNISLLGNLPADALVEVQDEAIQPGESTSISIEIPQQATGRDTFDLQVMASVAGVDTALREVRIITLSSDYTELQLLEPADGTSGIQFSTDFSWQDVPSAEEYTIEVATNPNFAEEYLIETATGLTAPEYGLESFLEEDDLYFWRVKPTNDCGDGPFLDPFVFQTATVDCEGNDADDLPIALPVASTERESKIFVTQDGIISDINVDNLEITYSPINALRVTLISPAGTEVILFNRSCLNTTLLRGAFDDEAPDDINCPPINFIPVQPEEPLSAFDGESTFGEWTLVVEIVESGFGGGSINKWNLEFCAAITPEAPTLLTNEGLRVPKGLSNAITNQELRAEDEDMIAPQQIEYQLLTLPQHGQLFRANELLQVGDEFTQQTIDVLNLRYVHDGSDAPDDQFTFIVKDNEGGWLPTQTFNIIVDEEAVVNTKEVPLEETALLYPNPAREEVWIDLGQRVDGEVRLQIFDGQGRLLRQQRQAGNTGAMRMDVSGFAAGMYFVHLFTDKGQLSRKLIIE